MAIKSWAVILPTFFLISIATAFGAEGPSPMETLKQRIDQVIAVLNDPAYKKPGMEKAERDKLWEIARPMFDFREISRRTVGPKWSDFTEEEKDRFAEVFARFLANTYFDKIQGEYHNEKVVYANELVRGQQALVRTKLVRENTEIPIDYRMHLEAGQWKIYDILVENGVSLVQNYRVQFQSILQKESPKDLIERLEKKLQEQQASSGGQQPEANPQK